jgi:hypothetical protein
MWHRSRARSDQGVADVGKSQGRVLYCKTSYLDTVGQPNCNSEVEQAEPQDIDKTLGQEPVGQIGAAAHISFNQTER